jgi:hypothetical protein
MEMIDPNELSDPVSELSQLQTQLAGLVNLVGISQVYKTNAAAKAGRGVAIEDIIQLEKVLNEAILAFYKAKTP